MGFSTEGFLEEAARFRTCVAQVGTGWTDNKKASVVPRGPKAQGSPHSAVSAGPRPITKPLGTSVPFSVN